MLRKQRKKNKNTERERGGDTRERETKQKIWKESKSEIYKQ